MNKIYANFSKACYWETGQNSHYSEVVVNIDNKCINKSLFANKLQLKSLYIDPNS